MENNFGQAVEVKSTLLNSVMKRVYFKMFMAMLVTAVTAFYVSGSESLLSMIYGNQIIFFGLIIAELGVVLYLSGRLHKLSNLAAKMLFYVYSILNGVVLSSVLLVYTGTSVFTTFVITAGVFAAMSIYGYFTSNDLSRFGSIMFMALIGLIICSVVNLFMQSSTMDWIISFAGVVIFIGLTAWDTQKIKQSAMFADAESAEKLSTIGALGLYLDFVNMFLYLLRFFGNRE
jgi:FtsH-binding integral membrane protein